MSAFTDSEHVNKLTSDELIYELKAIVIHRGGPYGGHYYAYMKDDLKQGNWNRNIPTQFDEKPKEKQEEKKETNLEEENKSSD